MENKKWYEIILSQVSSGRWILTVVVAIAFLILVNAYVKFGADKSISSDAITAITSMVFTFYFLKNRTDNGNGTNGNGTTTTTTTLK